MISGHREEPNLYGSRTQTDPVGKQRPEVSWGVDPDIQVVVWTENGSEGTFYVHQAKKIELDKSFLDMYICQGSI